jgi:hypothetical protein
MEENGATRVQGPVKRSVTIKLSWLAFEALGVSEKIDPQRVGAKMAVVARFYLGDRGTGRPAWPYPAHLRGGEVHEDVELSMSIDDDLWLSFATEADRQDVSIQQLSEHAAFYFAAESDAGRITQRLLEDLESKGAED